MVEINKKESRYLKKGFIDDPPTFSWNQWFQEDPDLVIDSLKKRQTSESSYIQNNYSPNSDTKFL